MRLFVDSAHFPVIIPSVVASPVDNVLDFNKLVAAVTSNVPAIATLVVDAAPPDATIKSTLPGVVNLTCLLGLVSSTLYVSIILYPSTFKPLTLIIPSLSV